MSRAGALEAALEEARRAACESLVEVAVRQIACPENWPAEADGFDVSADKAAFQKTMLVVAVPAIRRALNTYRDVLLRIPFTE